MTVNRSSENCPSCLFNPSWWALVDTGRYWSLSDGTENQVSSYTECAGGLQTWPYFHFPWLCYPLLNKVTAHFSFFIRLKGPYRHEHETPWHINPKCVCPAAQIMHTPLPDISLSDMHTLKKRTFSKYQGLICSWPPSQQLLLISLLSYRPFNYIRKRTTAQTMIACNDSDPFKAITRQNMESKAGDYSVNDFFFWHCFLSGVWPN